MNWSHLSDTHARLNIKIHSLTSTVSRVVLSTMTPARSFLEITSRTISRWVILLSFNLRGQNKEVKTIGSSDIEKAIKYR